MYRVLTEQRGATVVAVPRLGPNGDYALDARPATRSGRRRDTRPRSSGCAARTTRRPSPSPTARSRRCSPASPTDAAAAGRAAPVVVLDEAYAEFVGSSLLGLREAYPNLIVVRTASKAYALAGLRVGFAVARPEVIARLNPFRPPGSVSTVSVTLVTEALLDPAILDANLARVVRERARLTEALARGRAGRRPVGHELHPGRLRERRAGGARSPRRCSRAASCRGRSAPAIRSPTTSA